MNNLAHQSHYEGRYPGGIEPLDVMHTIANSVGGEKPFAAAMVVMAAKHLLRTGAKAESPLIADLTKCVFYLVSAILELEDVPHAEAKEVAKTVVDQIQSCK